MCDSQPHKARLVMDEAAPARAGATAAAMDEGHVARPVRARRPTDPLRPEGGGLYTTTAVDEALEQLDVDLARGGSGRSDDDDEAAQSEVRGDWCRAPSNLSNLRARAPSLSRFFYFDASWDTWEALRTLAREPFERPPRALTTPEHKQPLTYSTAMSVSRRLISTLEIGMHCARSS